MWSLPDSAKAHRLAGAEERALVKAAQTGSEAAVEELFRRHWPHTHRAAYLNGGELRVVAGDGTGDRPVAPAVADVAPAWEPASLHLPRSRGAGRTRRR